MALNYIWIAFFLIAFVFAGVVSLVNGNGEVFSTIVESTFSSAKLGFEISLGLTGVLTLWMGIMKIGERSGVISSFANFCSPVFSRFFPEIPKKHPVIGSIFMNFSANILGLDNAATPIGLNTMKQLQELNPEKDQASNSMIMFLIFNASGLTLFPITIMMYRAQLGAMNPADILVPIVIATGVSTMVAVGLTSIKQRINLLTPYIIIPTIIFITLVALLVWMFLSADKQSVGSAVTVCSNLILFSLIIGFITMGLLRKINVYESFIDGAKDGFNTAVSIIPYLIAILVAIGVFRASGAMEYIMDGIGYAVRAMGLDDKFVGAIPTMLIKPLSGSGARGMMIDAMNSYGADSFVGRLTCIVQGTTDTTFYVVALYFGSIAIKKIKYTLTYSLIGDLAGIIAAIAVCYLFFS